jgi:hypothetical protein
MVVKLKWPGLTPLFTEEESEQVRTFTLYPNPVTNRQTIHLLNTSAFQINRITMRNLQGEVIPIDVCVQSKDLHQITLKTQVASGFYWITCLYEDTHKSTLSNMMQIN